jgi:hypothetical protein
MRSPYPGTRGSGRSPPARPRSIAVIEHKRGAPVRRPARNEPKVADASSRTTLVASGPERAEYSDLVELARRMSIPDDDAIRQFVDLAMGLPATAGTSEHR